MLVIHSPLNIIHSRIWQATAFKQILPFASCPFRELSFDQCLQLNSVMYALVVGHEAIVTFPFRFPKLITENAKKTIVCTSNKDIAISGFETLIWNDGC